MNSRRYLIVVVALLPWVALRLAASCPWPEELDSGFFVAGVERYAVAEQRPHFPGYPVYIWVGMWLNMWMADTPRALHLLSGVATTLVTLPLMALATHTSRVTGSSPEGVRWAGWGAALAWNVCPLTWVDGTEIFSDPLAILGLTTFLWGVCCALEGNRWWRAGVFVLGGLVLGVRLSYLPMLWPLGLLLYQDVCQGRGVRGLLHLLLAGAAVGSWLGWQWYQEGDLLWEAARRHLSGHVEQWGGSWYTDPHPWSRPLRLFRTTLTYGLGGWWWDGPWWRGPATLFWGGLLARGGWALWRSLRRREIWLLPGVGLVYSGWLIALHDVELARYTFPLVMVLCWVVGVGLASLEKPGWIGLGLGVAVCLVTVPLALQHPGSVAPERQVATWLKGRVSPPGATLFTDLRFSGLRIWLPGVRVLSGFTRDVEAQAHAMVDRGHVVYSTSPPVFRGSSWQVVATFCRDPWLRSRGPSTVYLLQFMPSASPHPIPPCEAVKPPI